MSVIRIREVPGNSDGSKAILSFDSGQEYPITITDPFSEAQEEQLEWYFEEYLRFPFLQQVKAKEAATSIKTYGETLISADLSRSTRAGASPAPPIYGLDRLIRRMVGATLAVALALKSAPMGKRSSIRSSPIAMPTPPISTGSRRG